MTAAGDLRYLVYIDESITRVRARTTGGRDAFLADSDTQDAVLWRLQTLAEATHKLSPSLEERHPEIRWRAIYGFRNIAAHGYLDLHLDRAWEIVEVHLPPLESVISEELDRAGAE